MASLYASNDKTSSRAKPSTTRKFYRAACFPAHNGSDERLRQANDPVGYAVRFVSVHGTLLLVQLYNGGQSCLLKRRDFLPAHLHLLDGL